MNITKLFCGLHSMLLLLQPAAILEISVATQKRRGKFCHLISIQSTHFVCQVSTLSRKCQNSYFPLLQYGRRWLQFPNYRYSFQSYFSDQWPPFMKDVYSLSLLWQLITKPLQGGCNLCNFGRLRAIESLRKKNTLSHVVCARRFCKNLVSNSRMHKIKCS